MEFEQILATRFLALLAALRANFKHAEDIYDLYWSTDVNQKVNNTVDPADPVGGSGVSKENWLAGITILEHVIKTMKGETIASPQDFKQFLAKFQAMYEETAAGGDGIV